MTGYVRKDTVNNIANGNIISAVDLDNEFDGVVDAFNASTGHKHDGTTGEGAPITVVGPTQDVAISATAVTPKTTNTVDLGSSSLKFKDIFITGTATLPTVSATTVGATTGNITTVNATTVDTTNIEVTNIKAKDGTASATIADTTGVMTIASAILTTADINGGTIDGTTIGGTTAAAGAFTTLSASGGVTLSGGTANGVAYLNGSKVLTTGSALTFDGTRLTSTVGKFGGGAASNSASLMVNNVTNTATGIQLFQDGIESWIMGMPANSAGLAWSASGSEQMRLTSTGLGIGTSSPLQKLSVAGNIALAAASFPALKYYDNSSNLKGEVYYGVGGNDLNLVNYASGPIGFIINSSERMRLDSSGNLGLGVTPSAWFSNRKAMQIGGGVSLAGISGASAGLELRNNAYLNASGSEIYLNSDYATLYASFSGQHRWYTAPSGTAGNAISFTQAMTLTAGGELLVGTTSPSGGRAYIVAAAAQNAVNLIVPTVDYFAITAHNQATSGDNAFIAFGTEASFTFRGSITYNRGVGLVAYNTTSDYRAKDIIGPVTDSGALIDSVPVYMGKMKGATQERPMFIAHETPPYAHTGEKDAVDADGNPVYQQMDASALVPVMWAELQSLRKRVAALETT